MPTPTKRIRAKHADSSSPLLLLSCAVLSRREPTKPKKEDPDSPLTEAQQRDSPMITAIHGSHCSDLALGHSSSGNVAATILARSIGSDGAPGSRGSSLGGRGSSAGGAGAELFRRARHSMPNAANTASQQVQTGFPNSPRPPVSTNPSDAA